MATPKAAAPGAEKWLSGEVTLRELLGLSDAQMRKMAEKAHQWVEQARFADARVALEGLIALEPRQSYFWAALGAVDLAEGKWVLAERRCSYALTLDERQIAAYVNRGEASIRLGKFESAAADLRRAMELEPNGASPLHARARALAQGVLQSVQRAREARGELGTAGRPKPRAGR
jgi:predicted Zn-dependent protease